MNNQIDDNEIDQNTINELLGSSDTEQPQPLELPDESKSIENEVNQSEVDARDSYINDLQNKLDQSRAARGIMSGTTPVPEQSAQDDIPNIEKNQDELMTAKLAPAPTKPAEDQLSRYQKLLDDQKNAQSRALLIGGLTEMAQGLAGKNVPNYRPTTDLTSVLMKKANQPIESYGDIQKLQLADVNLKDTKDVRNPTSRISVLYKEYAKSKGLQVDDGMSAHDVSDLLKLRSKEKPAHVNQQSQFVMKNNGDPVDYDPNTGIYTNAITKKPVATGEVQRNYVKTVTDPNTGEIMSIAPGSAPQSILGKPKQTAAQVNPSNTKDVFTTLNPKQRHDLEEISKEFATETKDSRDFNSQISGVLKDVDNATKNPNMASSLGGIVAKLIESGRLTDEDTKRYTGRAGLLNHLKDRAHLMSSGTITQDQANDIKESLQLMQKTATMKTSTRAIEKSKKFTNAYGDYKPESIAPLIYGEYQAPAMDDYVTMLAPDGSKARVRKSEVNKYLQKGAKLINE